MRRTIAAASGDGCSAESTQGLNLAGRFVFGRCFLRLVHFRVQCGNMDTTPNANGIPFAPLCCGSRNWRLSGCDAQPVQKIRQPNSPRVTLTD